MNKFPINRFSHKFTSQIRPIKIYLPEKETIEDDVDSDFIGRKLLMDKLYNWILDKNTNGSYLITGFRGMGKTSMVDRVLSRIQRKIADWKELCGYISLFLLLCSILFLYIMKNSTHSDIDFPASLPFLFLVLSIVFAIIINLNHTFQQLLFIAWKYRKFSKNHAKKMVVGDGVDKSNASYNNIVVKVNLGHEVLKERDVLSMVANSIREKYKRFSRSVQAHFAFYYFTVFLVGFSSWGLTKGIKNLFEVIANKLFTYKEYLDGKSIFNFIGDNWFAREFYNICKLTYQFVESIDKSAISTIILFALFSFVSWRIILKILSLLPYTSIPSMALKELNVLSERIEASTDEESGSSTSFERGGISISLFGGRKKKTYPKSDIREIEQNLSRIINMLNVKHHLFSANFIVIFDEMDKIDPEASGMEKDADLPEYTDTVKGFPDGLDSRGRRQNVLNLLANMKLFLSTASAKFIFISGRELYDAYLADLSDRDYSVSSIFSGVINVDSFLSPEDDQTDVKSMAEWYIAKKLIPSQYLKKIEKSNAKECNIFKQERPSLRWYYHYLFDITKNEEQRRDVIYTVMFLRIYAAYLTHISNGSPKKMFLYFNKYIRKEYDVEPMNEWNDICQVGKKDPNNENQMILWFDPVQQRTINFVHYLTNSFMQTITNDYSKFGDRFLVSLTFIIDHLYKHHSRAFSWRNLEQIPDLFKTNRAPELRDSLASIMEYLTQTDIVKIPIGLNEFKFKKSISEEISLLSKISDEASALFNFTLDESSSVIQHNTKILQHYMNLAKSDSNASERYYPVLARIHANLGDLHFWDEDYYKAALEYRNAIQLLKKSNNENEYNSVLSMVRCSLKMGLTYESRKLYLNAYQNYCSLVNTLIKERWINEKSLGLDIVDQRVSDWRWKRKVLVNSNNSNLITKEDVPKNVFKQQFNYAQYQEKEYNQYLYSVNVDGMISSFAKDLTPEKSQFISKLTLFEEVRYLYQVILAKLSILEKMEMSGITQTNIEVAEGEFNALHKSVNLKEKFVISADFFRKLAEILYYKNSLTLSSQNQNSIYSSLYYADVDLLSNLDDFCRDYNSDAIRTKTVLKSFFYKLDESYDNVFKANNAKEIFNVIFINTYKSYDDIIMKFCMKNINDYQSNGGIDYNIKGAKKCREHREEMRKRGLHTPCLACKYYNRSIRILIENLYGKDKYRKEFDSKYQSSKSLAILHHTFKNELLYASSTHLDIFAKSVEGMGNISMSCASKPIDGQHILSSEVIKFLSDVCYEDEDKAIKIIEQFTPSQELTRLDKCLLYYFDAYRIYLMFDHYDSAVTCLNKIVTVLLYYVKIIRIYSKQYKDNKRIVQIIIGEDKKEIDNSLIGKLYKLVTRYTAFKYDMSNHAELRDLRWIYYRESYQDIDLSFLSLYPNLRCTLLRSFMIIADGIRYIDRVDNQQGYSDRYINHIVSTYPMIAPSRRFETTSYDDVIGLFTKACYNEYIFNCLLGCNVMTSAQNREEESNVSGQNSKKEKSIIKHYGAFYLLFYDKLASFLENDNNNPTAITKELFDIKDNVKDRLDLVEYLITDSLVCLSKITRLVTQHNHLSSYSKAFGGIVHNYMWEWSHKYELLLKLYKYQEICKKLEELKTKKLKDEQTQLINKLYDRYQKICNALKASKKLEELKKLKELKDEQTQLIDKLYNNYQEICNKLEELEKSKELENEQTQLINKLYNKYQEICNKLEELEKSKELENEQTQLINKLYNKYQEICNKLEELEKSKELEELKKLEEMKKLKDEQTQLINKLNRHKEICNMLEELEKSKELEDEQTQLINKLYDKHQEICNKLEELEDEQTQLINKLNRSQEICKKIEELENEQTQLTKSIYNRLDMNTKGNFDDLDKCRGLIEDIDKKDTATGSKIYKCIKLKHQKIDQIHSPYGKRSDILYARLRRDIDDVTISTIFSNYSAESAINYYKMAEEENTEGDAYKDMIDGMHFLDDDFNNDTSQFNLACERLLMNFDIVSNQRNKLEYRYTKSRIYALTSWLNSEENFYKQILNNKEQFEGARYANSEYQ